MLCVLVKTMYVLVGGNKLQHDVDSCDNYKRFGNNGSFYNTAFH